MRGILAPKPAARGRPAQLDRIAMVHPPHQRPRPSTRARLLDELAAAATVHARSEQVARWWCKAAPDVPFRRCNAVLPPVGAATGAGLPVAFDQVRRWYRKAGQRLIVQVSTADPDHEALDAWLATQGLDLEAPVHVMVSSLSEQGLPRPEPSGALCLVVHRGVDERWTSAHAAIDGGGAVQRDRALAYGRMLAGLGDRAIGASASAAEVGSPVGVGFGVIDEGWVGIFGMATSPTHRRQGVATAVISALCQEAAGAGAAHAYLQVETDNHDALALYERLGFERSHGYHYRSEGSDPALGC